MSKTGVAAGEVSGSEPTLNELDSGAAPGIAMGAYTRAPGIGIGADGAEKDI